MILRVSCYRVSQRPIASTHRTYWSNGLESLADSCCHSCRRRSSASAVIIIKTTQKKCKSIRRNNNNKSQQQRRHIRVATTVPEKIHVCVFVCLCDVCCCRREREPSINKMQKTWTTRLLHLHTYHTVTQTYTHILMGMQMFWKVNVG